MKTNIYLRTILTLAIAGTMATSCDENAWNDHLKGFEEKNDEPISNRQSIDYTLTDADYKAISTNSANVALAQKEGEGYPALLASVGTKMAFSEAIPASKYVPAFFASTSFPYFTLTTGSAVNLTYDVEVAADPAIAEAAASQLYTVSTDNYRRDVWDSDDNFIDAFAPSKPAANYVPGLLADELDPADGGYAIVTYNVTNQEPVFGNVGGGDTPTPEFELSDVAAKVAVDGVVKINGVVTCVCAQGYVVTDKSGSLFVYIGSSFDAASMPVGSQVSIDGTIGAYNHGLQVIGNKSDVAYTATIVGTQEVVYPKAQVYTGADLEALLTSRTNDEPAYYVTLNGKAVLGQDSKGNTTYNVVVPGAEKAMGSLYQGTATQKAAFKDGEDISLTGYFTAIAGGRYISIVATDINGTDVAKSAPKASAAAVSVPTEMQYGLYKHNGMRWAVDNDFAIVQPADYKAMGRAYTDVTAEQAATLLPKYLLSKCPYASNGDKQKVLYRLSANGTTTWAAEEFVFDGAAWSVYRNTVTETSQFVMTPSGWVFDPSVTLYLPAGKNQPLSTKYFQACVDWVFENICVPLGDTDIKSGKFYVSSYGNNEYYSGTSAYQGNLDLRADKAIEKYPAGYEGMSNEEVVALEKKRFMEETMPGALAALHPEAKPVEGTQVLFTITFGVYDGKTTTYYTGVWEVSAPGTFTPVSCTWDEE